VNTYLINIAYLKQNILSVVYIILSISVSDYFYTTLVALPSRAEIPVICKAPAKRSSSSYYKNNRLWMVFFFCYRMFFFSPEPEVLLLPRASTHASSLPSTGHTRPVRRRASVPGDRTPLVQCIDGA